MTDISDYLAVTAHYYLVAFILELGEVPRPGRLGRADPNASVIVVDVFFAILIIRHVNLNKRAAIHDQRYRSRDKIVLNLGILGKK